MPNYNFRDTTTNEVFTEFMSNSEREKYLENNKNIEQLLTQPVGFVDSVRIGIKKPDNGFRDLLKEVNKNNPLGKGIKHL